MYLDSQKTTTLKHVAQYVYNTININVLMAINNYFTIHTEQLGVKNLKTTKLSRSFRPNTDVILLKQISQSPNSVKRMFCSCVESNPSCPGYNHSVYTLSKCQYISPEFCRHFQITLCMLQVSFIPSILI